MDIKQTNGSKGDILIIDDSQDNLSTLDAILKKEGYSVRGAPNGHTGLMIVNTLPPELILLDVKMPGMDGYEVCRKLKADPAARDIVVIFISALNDLTDIIKGFEAGGVDYITKPFRYKEVLARIKTHITFCHMQKDLEKGRNELETRVKQRTVELAKTNERLLEEIAERRQTEAALRNSERRFWTLVEAAPISFYETDAQGSCLYVNEQWRKLSGLTLEEALGDGWQKGLYEEDRTRVFQMWKEHMEDEEPWNMEYRFSTPDGKVSWVMGVATALRDTDGRITGYIGANTDITNRKRAEDELNKHKDHLEERVKERTAELEEKNAELERMNDLFVGREFRIKELRDKVEKL